jgi:hypothetical protein
MHWLLGSDELRVSDEGLRMESGCCASLAGRLADNIPPSVLGLSVLASAAAINASHAQIAAAGVGCSFRVQATATKLAAAATKYTENEASSTAQVQAIATPTVS